MIDSDLLINHATELDIDTFSYEEAVEEYKHYLNCDWEDDDYYEIMLYYQLELIDFIIQEDEEFIYKIKSIKDLYHSCLQNGFIKTIKFVDEKQLYIYVLIL